MLGERCCVACVVVMLDWVEDAKREKEGERMRVRIKMGRDIEALRW